MSMKLNIPIEVVFDDLNSMIDELGKLQKYKFGEGDDMILVDVCDVADILMRHVMAREAHSKQKTAHWIYQCTDYNGNDVFRCSECNSFDAHDGGSPYCWYCGCQMDGESE